MKYHLLILALVTFGFGSALSAADATPAKPAIKAVQEKIVTWNQLPSSVQQSLARENIRDDIQKIMVLEKNRLMSYSTFISANGQQLNLLVSISGKISKPDPKDPAAAVDTSLLTWKQLAPAVQQTIQAKADRGDVRRIIKREVVTDPKAPQGEVKKTVIQADVFAKGALKELQIAEDGAFLQYTIKPSEKIIENAEDNFDDGSSM